MRAAYVQRTRGLSPSRTAAWVLKEWAAVHRAAPMPKRGRLAPGRSPHGRRDAFHESTTRSHRRVFEPFDWPPYPTEANDDYCPVCDERFANFRAGISYESAAAELRRHHGGELRGGSDAAYGTKANHGDVLRYMGVLKLNAWRDRHGYCTWPEDAPAEYVEGPWASRRTWTTSSRIWTT